jgi:type I restriction enzyme S subunit
MICDTVYRFRCRESKVAPEYLELALNSPLVVMEIDARKSGISDSGVSLTHKKLSSVMIPLPDMPEQRRIVHDVGRLLSQIDAVADAVVRSLRREAAFRQSILKWAFEGKLVEQDPNDEPASVLLERIKAECSASRRYR